MTHLGVLCNLDPAADPRQQLSPSVLNRAHLIGKLLKADGIQLFLYSPKDVTPDGDAPGYAFENGAPVSTRQALPRVNANWSYATRRLLRQGMGYQPFKRWMRERGHDVYVPYDFSELVSNKLKAFDAVRAWNATLHPHTEAFAATVDQIESFLERSALVFIKPRAGHKGNRIFVLRRSGGRDLLDYYDSRGRRSLPCISTEVILTLVDTVTRREHYIVQEGIESLRHHDAVFDVRVVMVNDGAGWHELFETRLAPVGSALSNVYQGGTIHVTHDLLTTTVGARRAKAMEGRLREISHGLAQHLESRYPGALPEIGFDYVLDRDGEPHLVEVNAKPGIAGIGSERRFFDWAVEEKPLHEMWTIPHMTHLASFLRRKMEALRSTPELQEARP